VLRIGSIFSGWSTRDKDNKGRGEEGEKGEVGGRRGKERVVLKNGLHGKGGEREK